jgi:two-component system cell cycle sensor histidine kinase/response regulator CckA
MRLRCANLKVGATQDLFADHNFEPGPRSKHFAQCSTWNILARHSLTGGCAQRKLHILVPGAPAVRSRAFPSLRRLWWIPVLLGWGNVSSETSVNSVQPKRGARRSPRASHLESRPAKNVVKPSAPTAGAALEHANRMEAVGRLAGGIAHDFNNLLTVILGHAEFLLKKEESRENFRGRVEEIRKAAQRGARLTGQLLAYGRKQQLAPTTLHMNAVLQDMDGILRTVLGEDIVVESVLDRDLGWTCADRGQLEQVILNLVANARDAMPRGGRLKIETSNVEARRGNAGLPSYVAPRSYVCLLVRDTGIGIEPETKEHIFEPFFTTKQFGKGTGLGLATVYGILKQSGGYIWVESEAGAGSSFFCLLPRVRPPASSPTVQATLDFRSRGGTILLVEDEAPVRRMAEEVLRSLGYRVLSALHGTEALRIAAEYEGAIDLLLTDVVMPGLTGPEVARRFAAMFPKGRVLYMSGYTDEAIEHHGLRRRSSRVLQKPFTHESLSIAVGNALNSIRRAARTINKRQ